jgi:hypothetical protein
MKRSICNLLLAVSIALGALTAATLATTDVAGTPFAYADDTKPPQEHQDREPGEPPCHKTRPPGNPRPCR